MIELPPVNPRASGNVLLPASQQAPLVIPLLPLRALSAPQPRQILRNRRLASNKGSPKRLARQPVECKLSRQNRQTPQSRPVKSRGL
jgi:hypothetical protein